MKLFRLLILCLFTCAVFAQDSPKYQVATIVAVKPHQPADAASETFKYDVSVKVGEDTYVVLYANPSGGSTVQFVAGRQLLVRVEKTTIAYNDILGRAEEVTILSKTRAGAVQSSK